MELGIEADATIMHLGESQYRLLVKLGNVVTSNQRRLRGRSDFKLR